MNNQSAQIPEQELAEIIIHLHDDVGLGFRKLSEELRSQGIEIKKDRAHRLYRKYSAVQKVNRKKEIADEELSLLNQKVEETEQNVQLIKAKDEKRRQLATLLIRGTDLSFQRRMELFKDKAELFNFAQKVLPFTNPAVWLKLADFCTAEKIDLEDAISDAIGSQADYEEVRMGYKKEKREYFLNEYLCLCVEDWLLQQQNEELEEETEDSADNEPNITIHVVEAPKEYVRIPLEPSTREWVDSKGVFHITIPPDDEYITIPLGPVEYEEIVL